MYYYIIYSLWCRRARKFLIQEKMLISIQTLCKFALVGTDFCPLLQPGYKPQSRSNLKYEEFQYQVNYSNYSIKILSQPSFYLLLLNYIYHWIKARGQSGKKHKKLAVIAPISQKYKTFFLFLYFIYTI